MNIIQTFKTQQLATQSNAYRDARRILAKPYKDNSVLLDCKELCPRIDPVTLSDAPAVFNDGVLVTPEKAHTEYVVQADFQPQDELTPEQIAEGWTLLFTSETLAQYKLDNAEAIAAESPTIETVE